MTDTAPDDATTAAAWLEYLYGPVEGGWLTLFAIDRTDPTEKHTRWFRVDGELDQAATVAAELSARCCVWFGVATRTERLVGKRGGAEHCATVPALWLDLDVASDVHAQDNLPPDRDAARAILDRFPHPPTAVVDSGHGLQAWWVLDEPADASEVAEVLPRWNATWARLAQPFHVDNVFDLPRIMRLPGTVNRKADPRPVIVTEADWERTFDLADLAEGLDDPPAPPEPRTSTWTGDEGLPGQVFNARHTGDEILLQLGFTHSHDTGADRHYTRPGKEPRQGSSATVYADGHTTIWSDTVVARWPALEVRRPYDPFGLYACTVHAGDHSAAAAELERRGYGTLPRADTDALDSLLADAGKVDEPTHATAEPQPPRLLTLRWVDTYLDDPPPAPEPIVEGLLNAGEFMVVGAERGIGKTWLGYNLASLLTTGGGSLFGRLRIPQPRRVLYLQGELDETQANVRWRMLHGIDDLGALSGKAASLPHLAESFDQVKLRAVRRRSSVRLEGETITDEFVDAHIDPAIEATIEALEAEVVIIDPWAVFFAGNENSNDEVEAVLQELRHIGMRRRVAWVIFHHIGKNRDTAEPEDLWRGASRLADWAANRVTITRHYSERKAAEAGLTRSEARRYARLNFLRRGAPLEDFHIHLDPDGWWRQWDPPEEGELGERTGLQRSDVLDALAANGGQFRSLREASEALDVAQGTAREYLDRLVADGWVVVENGARNAHVYRLREVTDDPK